MAASLPVTSAHRSWSRLTVGSSPYQSSPTSASAMAVRMAGVGRVTVSDRRSIGAVTEFPSIGPGSAGAGGAFAGHQIAVPVAEGVRGQAGGFGDGLRLLRVPQVLTL